MQQLTPREFLAYSLLPRSGKFSSQQLTLAFRACDRSPVFNLANFYNTVIGVIQKGYALTECKEEDTGAGVKTKVTYYKRHPKNVPVDPRKPEGGLVKID